MLDQAERDSRNQNWISREMVCREYDLWWNPLNVHKTQECYFGHRYPEVLSKNFFAWLKLACFSKGPIEEEGQRSCSLSGKMYPLGSFDLLHYSITQWMPPADRSNSFLETSLCLRSTTSIPSLSEALCLHYRIHRVAWFTSLPWNFASALSPLLVFSPNAPSSTLLNIEDRNILDPRYDKSFEKYTQESPASRMEGCRRNRSSCLAWDVGLPLLLIWTGVDLSGWLRTNKRGPEI